jgi:SIR2-like domain
MTMSDVIIGQTLQNIYKRSTPSPIKKTEIESILKSAFQKELLCLVAGAGISVPYKLPAWARLIQRVSQIIREPYLSRNPDLIAKYFIHRSPLVLARSMKVNLRYPDEFPEVVGKALYEDYTHSAYPTALSAIARVANDCAVTPRRFKVITFNYDSLLEEELLSTYGCKFDIVYDEKTYRHAEKSVRVSHVHGYLPRCKYMQDDVRMTGIRNSERSENIILSEDDYHTNYQLNFSWSNVELISSLTNYTCLYVGLSFDDPNLRRIIDIANLYRRPFNHILIAKQLSAGEAVYPNSTEPLSASDADTINQWQEMVLAEMGIRTFYITDYKELHDVILSCM